MSPTASVIDPDKPWFHGSPFALTELRPGSTITRDRALAKAFSHRPSLEQDTREGDAGALRHNGRQEGWLYLVDDVVRDGDVVPVPGSTMGAGQESLTTRPLRVVAIERTTVSADELLSAEEEHALRMKLQEPRRRDRRGSGDQATGDGRHRRRLPEHERT